jgi:hypothetical protein
MTQVCSVYSQLLQLFPHGQFANAVKQHQAEFSSLAFGVVHLTNIETVVPVVPKWLPLGGAFWAALTEIAFALAGLAIISGVLEVLAARLLGAMLLVFSGLALAPLIFASPRNHVSLGVNAYNLAAVGAA